MSSGRASVLSFSILPLLLSACGDKPRLPGWAGDGSVDPVAGAAAINAFGRLHAVAQISRYCAGLAPELAEPMRRTAAAWNLRNASLVRAAGKMQAHTRSQWLAQGVKGRERWAEEERLMAGLFRGAESTFPEPVGPASEPQIRHCSELIGEIDRGLFDIARDDPKVLELLGKFQD